MILGKVLKGCVILGGIDMLLIIFVMVMCVVNLFLSVCRKFVVCYLKLCLWY